MTVNINIRKRQVGVPSVYYNARESQKVGAHKRCQQPSIGVQAARHCCITHPLRPCHSRPTRLDRTEQATVKSCNAALTCKVAEYELKKQELEEDMRARRDLYSDLFGPPLKPAPPAGRKGKPPQ